LPELRTLQESGLPGFVVTTWQGLFAPAGTPAPIVERINAEFVKAIRNPDLKAKLEQQDMEPTGTPVKAFAAAYRAELERWTKVARDAGLKAE
jgi:tripartite-type tricarboxylate transporter receptor subunit TctC